MVSLSTSIRSYFDTITEQEIEVLSSFFIQETVSKGQSYLSFGEKCTKLGFVKEGYLRIYADTEFKEVTQWIASPGYFVTDLAAFVLKQNCKWNFAAITDVEVLTLHEDNYQRLFEVLPTWSQLEKIFITKCFSIMEDRIFSHLSLTAEERYDLLFTTNKDLFNRVPLQYIASMLGMTPETLSRIRRKM